MSLAAAKAQSRREGFARRKAAHGTVDPAPALAALQAVLAAHTGKTVSGYMAIRSEIDPLPVMAARAAVDRAPVCVPVIDGPDRPLRFRRWTPQTEMTPGVFGALVPSDGAFVEPEILIVPLVAFDAAGFRLGYGGGFYDRTLARLRLLRGALAVGFAYAAQQADALPTEPTDQPLDAVVTERGVQWFAPSATVLS